MSARPRPATFVLREQAGVVTSRVTVAFVTLLGAVSGVLTIGVALIRVFKDLELLVLPVGLGIGAVVAFAVAHALRRRSTPPPVEVTDAALSLPLGMRSARRVHVPLETIRSIEMRGTRAAPFVLFGTDQGFQAVPVRAFIDDDGPVALRDTVREAIALRPQGPAQLAAMRRVEEDGRALVRKKPRATQVLLGVITAVFAFELLAGSPADARFLIRWGANAPALVSDGQWWRLCVAGLMHLSVLHFVLNASALLSLGGVVERLLGTPRFVVVALGASVAGNAASMLSQQHVFSAGTSSLVFGLIGALLLVNVRFGRSLPVGFLLGPRRWAWLLGINGAVSLLPGVDGRAHVGGALGGVLLCALLVPRISPDNAPPRPLHVGLAAATVAAFVLALGLAVERGITLDEETERRDLERAMQRATR